MREKTIQTIKLFLGWPLSLISLLFIVKFIIPKSSFLTPHLKEINILLMLLSVLCFFTFFLLRSILWQQILKEKGHSLALKETVFLWGFSELKRYIPGKIWFFFSRVSSFASKGVGKRTIFESLFVEAELIVVSSFIISLFSFPFVFKFVLDVPNMSLIKNSIYFLSFLGITIFVFSKFITKRLKNKKLLFISSLLPNFSPKTNISLIFISILTMFFFGLGNFFAISSLFFLDSKLIFEFVGIFVLSFLIGYLSFIAPMGLGIREGAVTIGLSKVMTLAQAGLSSIFSRVVLVVSEIAFLIFISSWRYSKNKTILKIESFVKTHKHESALFLLTVIYIFYFTTASFLRHDNFYTGRFDLGNMDQTVWNTVHGRIFQLTNPNGTDIISRLAFHADFLLILLAPFYLIWSDPKMLLLIQAIIIALGAYFVYGICIDVLRNKSLSLAFSIAFLFNPALQFTNLYDFHPVSLATTFLLGAFYFLKRKTILFILFLLLAGITKEQVWIIDALLALYFIYYYIKKKSKKQLIAGLGVFLASTAIFYFLVWYAIPNHAFDGKHFALSFYSDFGDSSTSVLANILLSPAKTISIVFQEKQLTYIRELFMPLGFISLLSPLYLIFALPDFFINLLSSNVQFHQIYYQYAGSITPFVFISAMFGIKNIQKRLPKISVYWLSFYILSATFISAYLLGPLPGSLRPNIDMFTKPLENKEFINKFLMKIPKRYSVAATNNIGAHMSHRQRIYTVPVGIDKADMVIFLLNDQFAQPSLNKQKEMVTLMEKDKTYKEILKIGDFVVFRKAELPSWNMNFRRRIFF